MTVQASQLPRKASVRFDLNNVEDSDESAPFSDCSSRPSPACVDEEKPSCTEPHTHSHATPTDATQLNLSFAGCGFLCVYHAGVCAAIKEYAPQLLANKVYGASAGAIVGAGLLCNVCISAAISVILKVISQAQRGTLKTLSPSFDLSGTVAQELDKMLPVNAHQLCAGRLFISLTRWSDRANVMVSDFETREELIQAIVCSSFIPVLCGLRPPQFRGVAYVDGGLSDNQPAADANTITVSPFSGEHDICPTDHDSASLLGLDFSNTNIRLTTGNLFRMFTCFFPPSLDICSKICRQGFQDALVLLTRKGLAPCVRCLTIQSNALPMPEYRNTLRRVRTTSMVSNPSRIRLNSECERCYESEFNAEDATVLFPSVLQKTIDEAKKAESRIFRYLNSFRLFRWSRYMMTPALIPLDFMVYSVKMVQSWLYPTNAVDYFFQRLQATVDLANSFLESQSYNQPRSSCRFSVADVERRPASIQTSRRGQSNSTENPYAVLEQSEGRVDDEGSVNELVKYTMEHDAILAYYYMDEENEMHVCEIFDVNNPDTRHPCHSRRSQPSTSRASTSGRSLPLRPAAIVEDFEGSRASEPPDQPAHNNNSGSTNEDEEDDMELGQEAAFFAREEADAPQMELEDLRLARSPASCATNQSRPNNGEDSGLSLTEDSNASGKEKSVKKRDAGCSPIRAAGRGAPPPGHTHRPSRASLFVGRAEKLRERGLDPQARGQSRSLTSLNRRSQLHAAQSAAAARSANSVATPTAKGVSSGPASVQLGPPPPLSSDSEQEGAEEALFVPLRARSASSNAYDGEPEPSDTDQGM